ncbi:MAG TPA: outer membrane protein assembly factor BamE [Gammaproteobacteria bacterium]
MRLSLIKLLPAVLASVFLLAACVYRQSIPQGNFFKAEDVAKLEEGMTREQVQFVMGTPMIADPFHPDRWDYLFYVDLQEPEEDFRQRVTVFFEGDAVARIEKVGLDVKEQEVPTGDEGILIEDEPDTPADDQEIFTGEE